MKFDPNETNEAAKNEGFALLPDGEYDAEVHECEEQISAKGDPMFKITLKIPDPNGGNFRHTVWDYISPRWFQRKFKSFFESMGQEKMYESGDIDPALLIHQYVTAQIETEPAGEYPAKNVVKMYVKAEVSAAKKLAREAPAAVKDDGLPFALLAPLASALVGAALITNLFC
jgi:hypothetical protein